MSRKNKFQTFSEFEDHFLSLPCKGRVLDLRRIRFFLDNTGNPEKKLKGVQVAGTNGKGSVSAMTSSIMTAAGYKTGLFTSPHLISYKERYRINDEEISKKDLLELLNEVYNDIYNLNKEMIPTWFEIMVIAAIRLFVREKVEFVILEVGMGGRLDATSIVPLKYKIITNVSRDHMEFLGDDLRSIAKEKLEVIKNGNTVVSGLDRSLESLILKKVKDTNSDYLELNRIKIFNKVVCNNTTSADFKVNSLGINKLIIGLHGNHQIKNAALVIGLVSKLRKDKYEIDNEAIRLGMKNVKHLGRFEIISRDPLIVIDGGHNEAGISALKKTYKEMFDIKPVALVSIKKNKDYQLMMKLLSDLCDTIYLPRIKQLHGKMYCPNTLKKMTKAEQAHTSASIKNAYLKAIKQKKPIIVTGSLYFLGEFMKFYKNSISRNIAT